MPPQPRADLDPDVLRAEINQMLEALTHPAYVEAMRTVRQAPREERLAEGSRRLNPDALRAAGVPLPDNMRISSRYFEEGLPDGIEFGDVTDAGNTINALNESRPGFLDRLRADRPEQFAQLIGASRLDFVATAGCCCGGAASACGGCGG